MLGRPSIVHDLLVIFFQAEDGIRDDLVTGVQTCALPISHPQRSSTRTPILRRRGPARFVGGARQAPRGAQVARGAAVVRTRARLFKRSEHVASASPDRSIRSREICVREKHALPPARARSVYAKKRALLTRFAMRMIAAADDRRSV